MQKIDHFDSKGRLTVTSDILMFCVPVEKDTRQVKVKRQFLGFLFHHAALVETPVK